MDKKEELRKAVLYVAIWWLVVMTCGLLGDLFPSTFRNQPQYDVWEEDNLILHIYTNTFYYYEIQEDEHGHQLFYVEAEEQYFAHCYLENNMMVVTSENLHYYELFRELCDELFDYYEWKEQQMVEISDNL